MTTTLIPWERGEENHHRGGEGGFNDTYSNAAIFRSVFAIIFATFADNASAYRINRKQVLIIVSGEYGY